MTKTCSRCHQPKPLDDFKTDIRKPDGKTSSCKACNAAPRVGDLPIAPSRALVRIFDSNDPDAWIARIAEEWRNSVEAIMKVGRSLIEAKEALPHGAFLQMLEDEGLPFGASTAQRLMAIARDRRLSNAAHLQHLPPSWGTLYEITKLSDEEFDRAIEQQIIRPDMERREVEMMRPAAYGRQNSDGPGSSVETIGNPAALGLQQGPATPNTVIDRDVGNVAKPEEQPESAPLVPPGPSEVLEALPRDDGGRLTPEVRKALAPIIKEIRSENQEEKKQKRDEKEKQLGDRQRQLEPGKAGLILSDFEWHFKVRSEETGMDRHASNHYVTAKGANTPEEIVERQRERMTVAADDCIHLMWCPASFNAIALKVMELQGFTYVSQFVWIKPGIGTGFWVRDRHELLLIGVKGKIPCPAMGDQFDSAIEAPKGAHSEKPDFQYEIAEHYFPSLPKIELNARRSREGWVQWGNEAPEQQSAETDDGEEAA